MAVRKVLAVCAAAAAAVAVAAAPASADESTPEQTSPACSHPVSLRVGGQGILEIRWREIGESRMHSYQPIQDAFPHDFVYGPGDNQIVWYVVAHDTAEFPGKVITNQVFCD